MYMYGDTAGAGGDLEVASGSVDEKGGDGMGVRRRSSPGPPPPPTTTTTTNKGLAQRATPPPHDDGV
jgi:hypothetical protein